ncbi:MAG: protein kinase [Bacteroidota bacterium]|nr:protein kinase [Bacteroidota bacterium]
MIGQMISHYRIIEKLGEGGMGVVYKAEDNKLKRIVALKFLPKEFLCDSEAKSRFVHEAQAASALNHPNITTVHEIDEVEGECFISMEYIEGKSIKELAKGKELPVEEILSIAIQIAEGLSKAHQKDIVHRDIKSDNIIITHDGLAKIMDFGLAKLKGVTKLTKTGTTLGTVQYMSPEQAQGIEIDQRSDIFSFGVVLYEMITGQLPFKGEHEAAVLYSLINETPEPLARYKANVPVGLQKIVDKALQKDRSIRYQSAVEIIADLKGLQKETTIVGMIMPKKKFMRIIIPSSVILITVILYLFFLTPHSPDLNPNMTFRVLPIPFTEIGSPGLSQDGNWAVFPASDASGKWDVYYMSTTSGESRRITSDSSGWMWATDISPDGSRIVFDRFDALAMQTQIAIVSCVGGSSRKVVGAGLFPRWRPDGQRIGYLRGKDFGSRSGKVEFWTIKPDGSDNRFELLDSVSSGTGRSSRFSWSPDGGSICWIRSLSWQCQEAMRYELSTGKEQQITFDRKSITDVCWTSNNEIVFASNKSGNYDLWMVPASGGSATQITKGAGPDYSMAISRDGSKLLYYQMEQIAHIWIAGTNGSNPHQITFDHAILHGVSFSPDGKKIVFGCAQTEGMTEGSFVCSIDRDGRNREQLTSGEEHINKPLKSPDGRWIIYSRYSLNEPYDSSSVCVIDARNPGTPKLVGRGTPIQWIDEKTFTTYDGVAKRMWLHRIDGGEPQEFFEDSTRAISFQGGKYIGYFDMRSGREGWWIRAAPGVKDPKLPSPRRLVLRESGEFDKSGKYFYWVKNPGELRRISLLSGEEEIIRRAFPGLSLPNYLWFDISFDGREIVYIDTRISSKLVMIENLFK